MPESEQKLKSFLVKVKQKSEKTVLKTGFCNNLEGWNGEGGGGGVQQAGDISIPMVDSC